MSERDIASKESFALMSEVTDSFSEEPFPAFIFLPKKLQPEVTPMLAV